MSIKTKYTIGFFVVITLFWPGSTVYAENQAQKTLSPYFFIEGGDPSVDRLPLKRTDVVVHITGVIADVTVMQQYTNEGTRPINASYIFPASIRAAVHGMTMRIGDNVIIAKIRKREAAQKEFDQAKKEGKSASLLKQQRPNVFSMRVANVLPKDTIHIRLRYTELLVPEDGTYEFIYPAVVGPRYASMVQATAPETDRWLQNPYRKPGSATQTAFHIGVNISTGLDLHDLVCTSHETDTIWSAKSTAQVLLKDPEKFGGNRDFILKFRLAGQKIESGMMLYAGEDENFFLLMVQPPKRVEAANIPPREYIFVVDVSGSMSGFPLTTAKNLLETLIGSLRPTDKFNLVLFAGASHVMAPESIPATQKNIRNAVCIIDNQKGGGGTELYNALQRSLSLPRDDAYSRALIIVTDGYIAAEKRVFQLIQTNLNRTNFFSFGIGSGVNRYLIEGMAKAGMGESFIVTKPHEAPVTVGRFKDYIRSPVLTKISIKYPGFEAYDIEPPAVPDLFAQRPLVIFGKWRGDLAGSIEVRGTGGKNEYARVFSVSDQAPDEMNRALRYLWARARIGRLADFNPKAGNAENRELIESLGLTYNLLTAYTSFIAVHSVARNFEGDSRDVKQPLPLPEGVSALAVGGTYSTIPEPELYVLLAILAVIALSMCFYRRLKYRPGVRWRDE